MNHRKQLLSHPWFEGDRCPLNAGTPALEGRVSWCEETELESTTAQGEAGGRTLVCHIDGFSQTAIGLLTRIREALSLPVWWIPLPVGALSDADTHALCATFFQRMYEHERAPTRLEFRGAHRLRARSGAVALRCALKQRPRGVGILVSATGVQQLKVELQFDVSSAPAEGHDLLGTTCAHHATALARESGNPSIGLDDVRSLPCSTSRVLLDLPALSMEDWAQLGPSATLRFALGVCRPVERVHESRDDALDGAAAPVESLCEDAQPGRNLLEPNLLGSLRQLGGLWVAQGRHADAWSCFRLAGDTDAQVTLLEGLASAWQSSGRSALWLSLYWEITATRQHGVHVWAAKLLAWDHPTLAAQLLETHAIASRINSDVDSGSALLELLVRSDLACHAGLLSSDRVELLESLTEAWASVDPSDESRAALGSRLALITMHLGHLASDQLLQEISIALPAVRSEVDQLEIATVLLESLSLLDVAYAVSGLIDAMARVIDAEVLPPRLQLQWQLALAARHLTACEGREAAIALRDAAHSSSLCDASRELPQLQCLQLKLLLLQGRAEDITKFLATHNGASWDESWKAQFHQLRARFQMRLGDLASAEQAVQQAQQCASEAPIRANVRLELLETLAALSLERNDPATAVAWLDQALVGVEGRQQERLELTMAWVKVQARLLEHDEPGVRQLLRPAIRAHRVRFSRSLLPHNPRIAASICERALAAEMDVDHVRALVIRQGLPSPDPCSSAWPHPRMIRSFGPLELSCHGEMVLERGKAQQKPMTMLAVLLACGRNGIDKRRLIGQLWDGDQVSAPVKALEITVHRLRKWLQCDDAVVFAQGRISLNHESLWTDCDALDQLETAIDGDPDTIWALDRRGQQLLALYRGDFCFGIHSLLVRGARDRHRTRFRLLNERIGRRLEDKDALQLAEALYMQCVVRDPVGEAAYRGLMRIAATRQDQASIRRTYDRCRNALRLRGNLRPSAETERLALESTGDQRTSP